MLTKRQDAMPIYCSIYVKLNFTVKNAVDLLTALLRMPLACNSILPVTIVVSDVH